MSHFTPNISKLQTLVSGGLWGTCWHQCQTSIDFCLSLIVQNQNCFLSELILNLQKGNSPSLSLFLSVRLYHCTFQSPFTSLMVSPHDLNHVFHNQSRKDIILHLQVTLSIILVIYYRSQCICWVKTHFFS